MRAWKRHLRQFEATLPVAIMPALPRIDKPVPARFEQRGRHVFGLLADRGKRFGWIAARDHQGDAGFRDPALLEGDTRHGGDGYSLLGCKEEPFVIDPKRCNAAGEEDIGTQHVGRIEPPAEADFDHAGIGGSAREFGECGGNRNLEEARIEILADIEHFAQQIRQPIVLDQFACKSNAFVIAHQMRAGGNMDRIPFRFQHCAQEGAGRSFAIGPGDMEHGGQPPMWVAEPVEQRADGLQAKPPVGHGQRAQPVELGLDGRMIGAGEVPHDAAQAALAGAR